MLFGGDFVGVWCCLGVILWWWGVVWGWGGEQWCEFCGRDMGLGSVKWWKVVKKGVMKSGRMMV